jgi:formylglycine-generating enzyme required for sulfatase activity
MLANRRDSSTSRRATCAAAACLVLGAAVFSAPRAAAEPSQSGGASGAPPSNVQEIWRPFDITRPGESSSSTQDVGPPPGGSPAAPAGKPSVASSAPAVRSVVPGRVYLFKECDVCPEMAAVPGGTNLIGSPDTERGRDRNEGPQQEIVIAQAFAVGRTEISFAEWLACVAEGGCNAYRPGDYGWGYGLRPVINVSWTDAQAYVAWLSRKTGATYRLLSEAEWEYAARGCVVACNASPFWFGAEISNTRANYDWRYSYEGSPKALAPRQTIEVHHNSDANPFGLLHMHGNVREWVEDCWNGSLTGVPRDGSARRSGDCRSHVVRGGSWADAPKDLRSAARSWEVTAERRAQIGFRVARRLTP